METMEKTNWKVDTAHSEIGFKVKHMMISTVSGSFNEFDASVETDNDNFKNGNFTFTGKIASIDTKNKDRDQHLKSADFFDAETYPELSFQSKSFDGDKMVGDLIIKDVTKEITIDVTFNGIVQDPYGQTKAGFEGSAELSRKEFGLNWNSVTEAGSIVVSDRVKLVLDLQFIKQ